MIWLRNDFKKIWGEGDPFARARNITGKIYREMPDRRTLQFQQGDESYFLKLHLGVGWLEIFKNLLLLRLPVLSARNEYNAIRHCERLGVPTMAPVAFAVRGRNPARRQSFIVTEDLVDTISLEDLCREWTRQPPPYWLKTVLINRVADISRRLHDNGFNHRDYYICHFLLKIPHGVAALTPRDLRLYLIDLHRAQLRTETPRRWIIKDLAALYFSVLDIGLSERDVLRFVRRYTGLPLKQAVTEYQWLWQPILKKAAKLRRRQVRYRGAL